MVFAKTPLTSQYLPRLEQLATLDYTLPVVPLANLKEELGRDFHQKGVFLLIFAIFCATFEKIINFIRYPV